MLGHTWQTAIGEARKVMGLTRITNGFMACGGGVNVLKAGQPAQKAIDKAPGRTVMSGQNNSLSFTTDDTEYKHRFAGRTGMKCEFHLIGSTYERE